MRRKTAKRLADLGRLAGIAVCTLAGVTAAVWSGSPATVDALEHGLREALVGNLRELWQQAVHEADPTRQRALLQQLLGRLPHVRRHDQLAGIVADCQLRLAALADASGNLTEAADWMRASVAFDDHDVITQARLGDLLCRVAATRSQGFDLLHALSVRFPANPHVTPVLVSNLIEAGRAEAALAVLDAADSESQSNLWTACWDTGAGFLGHRAAIVPTVHDGVLRLRFDLADTSTRLRFFVPCFLSMALVQPKLTVEVGDQRFDLDLLANAALHQVERRGDRLEAVGHDVAFFDVALPPLPSGLCKVAFEASTVPRRSRLLALPALLPGMGALRDDLARDGRLEALQQLQLWRKAACSGLPMQCLCAAAGTGFDDSRRVHAVIESNGDDGLEVCFRVRQQADTLRIHLPAQAKGLEWRWRTLELIADGQRVVLDPRTMPLLGSHQIERKDGAFVSTGDDPHFWFTAPARSPIDSVCLRGVL
jgi:hypothetical protein